MRTVCGTHTGPVAMVLYENSVDSRVFIAEWWITLRVILNRLPSVQGTMGLPRMLTQIVGDVQGPPPCSCTGMYSVCTKIL